MEIRELIGKDYEKIKGNDDIKEVDIAFLDEIKHSFDSQKKIEYKYSFLKDKINQNPNTERTNCDLDIIRDSVSVYSGENDSDSTDSGKKADGIIGYIRDRHFSYKDDEYDMSLRIRTRFDKDDKKCFFMAEMVRCYAEKCLDISLSGMEVPVEEENLLDFLKICIFRKKVIDAYKVGFYRKYTYFKKNDSKLRGRIDISRHIKENAGLKNGNIAYEYRENTLDNVVNHLILRTWFELKKEYAEITDKILDKETDGISVNKVLRQLQYMAPHYKDKSLKRIVNEAKVPVTSVYFSEYEELRKTCIDILNGLNFAIYTGSEEIDENVESLLFYVPDLWEVYVSEILMDIYPKGLMEQNKIEVLGDMGFYNYPDFMIVTDKGDIQLVLDAKFKPGWIRCKENPDDRIKDDIRQVLSYGELTGAKMIGVIFPIDSEFEEETFVDIRKIGIRKDVVFLVCGMKIPSIDACPNFASWKKQIDEEKSKIKKQLLEKTK